jgi:hypothetical protein
MPYKYTMSIDKQSKIQKMLQAWPAGTVATSAWFSEMGITSQLLKRYTQSQWVTPLASGAYIKTGDQVGWQGALYALQEQKELPVHAGALTALALQGYAHYVRLSAETVFLFSPAKTNLPPWLRTHDWEQKLSICQTNFLLEENGLVSFQTPTFSLKISAPERAILECLYLSPEEVDLTECYQMIEGMTTLRPKLVQSLLEQCHSVKVKRLFLYMARKSGHDWYKRLDSTRLDLGKGDRAIVKGGVYVREFGIVIPEGLASL